MLAGSLEASGWSVRVEDEDGSRAAKSVLDKRPRVVVISLSRLPSHGRETAKHLRSKLDSLELPIVFIRGDAQKSAQVQSAVPETILVAEEDLVDTLETFRREGG